MKKGFILPVLLVCLMGVTGCMINRSSFQEDAVSYMKEKYEENFSWMEPVGGQIGNSHKSGYVSTDRFPGKKILVEGEKGEKETFTDNYVAYLRNEEACVELQTIASSVDERWKAFCKPEEIGLSLEKDASALEYLQEGACLVTLFVPEEEWAQNRDDRMESFRKALWQKTINANITVYTLPEEEIAGLTGENYTDHMYGSGSGRFVMDEEGNFAVSKWR